MWTLLPLLLCGSASWQALGSTAAATTAIHLTIDQSGDLSPDQLREALDQTREIWRPSGVAISAGGYGEPSAAGELVVSLRIVHGPSRPVPDPSALAWTIVGPAGRPLPFLFVSLPAVATLLSSADVQGRPLAQRPQHLRERLLARAVGRIVAHELAHYLLHTREHASSGLLRARYSTTDLVGPWLDPFRIVTTNEPVVRAEIARLAWLQTASLR